MENKEGSYYFFLNYKEEKGGNPETSCKYPETITMMQVHTQVEQSLTLSSSNCNQRKLTMFSLYISIITLRF